ncbi:MAG: SEC-C domain-containing protein [Nitrospirae bacterium]|nr:SEC-C domain-containing protein [Nitrospirota bacterium]
MSGFDILIGMDIICQGDFAVTYKEGNTVLSFRTPPLKEIDFVQEINRSNAAGIKRNAPCPCGSGKKFKKCCGNNLIFT